LHAIANPHVDIIGHPSGRLLLKRDPYDVEWPEIFQAAATAGVALEVNAHPERLDLNDVLIKEALHSGVKLAISTDAHSHGGFERMMRYGVATARRGWAAAGDVINTWPLPKLLKWCRGKGKL
jgi:DNA polymerase (family 10)